MDQTDGGEHLVHALVGMVEAGRLKVRVYTKGRLHAKAYIFDWKTPLPGSEGIAVVGSSNLTLAGIRDNTELNVVVHDNGNPLHAGQGNHAKLTEWFEELWGEAQDFEAHLMEELRSSWAAKLARPYDIYMKTLYTLVKERLEGGAETEVLWDDAITRQLADFQKVAVRQAIQLIRDHGGCFVADVVGLGKSFIGAGIIKHFERVEQARPLIICPKPLEDMWVRYNEVYDLHAQVLPMSQLRAGDYGVSLLEDIRYRDRDFVLIDESHNFRHHETQRYQELQTFLATGRKVCLLTATPRNNRVWDVYNQIKLFHPDDTTDLPIDPPNLRQYFHEIEAGHKQLQDVLSQILIRRTRRHILRWYGYAADSGRPLREMEDFEASHYLDGARRAYVLVAGRHQFFPRRQLETLRYSIEETYSGLYQQLRAYLGKPAQAGARPRPGKELTYARYGLWRYVRPDRRKVAPYIELQHAGFNLRGLIRSMLFKRFESSVQAFRKTLERMIASQSRFLQALDEGFIPAGERAEALLGRGWSDDDDACMDALEAVSGRYDINDFDVDLLRSHVLADRDLLGKMFNIVQPITPDRDAKLQACLRRLDAPPIRGRKCLIFTQYADTAAYLYDNLNPHGTANDIEVIYGTNKSKSRVVGRFAPIANPEFVPGAGDTEIRLLVATDVLAEGLNMQDCDIILNYDLHWNPVRLIQRFGRIDRIGSEHDTIWGLNFLPETGLEGALQLAQVLKHRIQEIHDTIGEDAAILDANERLNESAMYSIYQTRLGQLSLFDEEDKEELVDLNQAEELLRSIQKDDPDEFKRIAELRDGIRSGLRSAAGDRFVFCQAGHFQQLFLVGNDGAIISRDLARVLGAIKATADVAAPRSLPDGYNDAVMRVKHLFTEEVKHRKAQRDHATSLTHAQRYVLRELRLHFSQAEDEDLKTRINILEQAFRLTPTAAINRELNPLRRNGITGLPLIQALSAIYHQHRLGDRLAEQGQRIQKDDIPRIVCSEALL